MHRKNRSVLRGYLASYLGVAFVACIGVGLILLIFSSTQLIDSKRDNYRARLENTATYLEQQLKYFEDVKLDIKTTRVYQPFYLKRNAFYELDLIATFDRYKAYSPLIREYYLLYEERNVVYTSSALYETDVFATWIMRQDNTAAFRDLLDTDDRNAFVMLPERPDALLYIMPFNLSSRGDASGACKLIFVVDIGTVEEDIAAFSGLSLTGGISISYEGVPVLEKGLMNDKSVTARSAEGSITLSVSVADSEFYAHLSFFRAYASVYIVLLLLFSLGVAAAAAYRSYVPFKKLRDKFAPPQNTDVKNEFQQIESLLENMTERNRLSHQQLDRQLKQFNSQRDLLRQQFLLSLLWGEDNTDLEEMMREVGILFPHPFYSVLHVHFDPNSGLDMRVPAISDLSDAEITLYPVRMRSPEDLTVIVNTVGEEKMLQMITEYEKMCVSSGCGTEIRRGGLCSNLNELPQAVMSAIRSTPVSGKEDGSAGGDQYIDRIGELMEIAIETGQRITANEYMDLLVRRIESNYQSVLLRYCMISDLHQRLSRIAYRMHADIPEIQAIDMLRENDAGILRQKLFDLIGILCAHAEGKEIRPDSIGSRIVRYIMENATSEEISLQSVAEHFRISTKQINRILKNEVNMTFKECEINQRIEAARKLLITKDLSVVDIAACVGYENVSHFIRLFSEHTGMTPAQFRMQNSDKNKTENRERNRL